MRELKTYHTGKGHFAQQKFSTTLVFANLSEGERARPVAALLFLRNGVAGCILVMLAAVLQESLVASPFDPAGLCGRNVR